MAIMKPENVDDFQNESEEDSYELLKKLDGSYTVVYEPSIGLQKRRTPDFVILSQKLGLIVLDVKYVNLDNIEKSDYKTITKKNGLRIKNFYQTVKDYAYIINNQLVKVLKDNSTIVHPKDHKNAGRLTFPHSSGLLLFIHNADRYTKEDVATMLSLNTRDFIIANNIDNDNELLDFLKNLNRPFLSTMTSPMKDEILKKIYIDSDASANEFINTMSQFNLTINKNFKESLQGIHFEKSKQLKTNLLEYAKFAQGSIETADKNLGLGCDNIIERLKGYKQELEEEKFTVAIFGYFSTGKSTFLNTLMNADKLPMDEDRSTATFTRLRHCEESEDFEDGDMQVIYKDELDISISYKNAINSLPFEEDDKQKYLDFDNLETFKNELIKVLKGIKIRDFSSDKRDSIKNAKKTINFILENNIPYGISDKVVKEDIQQFLTDDKKAFGISEVIYYLENELLKDIEIVDTPGYGSENTMDTFKTQEFVKEANVLILLTEAKDPMSKADEQTFLETYEKIYREEDGSVNTDNLFIIANKVDESTKTVEEIKDSIVKKIEDNWEDSLIIDKEHIYTMSSKYHYEKDILQEISIESKNISDDDLTLFIDNYSKFLTINKDKEFVRNNFQKIDEIISELNNVFTKEVNSMNRSIEDIRVKKELFKANKKEIEKTYRIYGDSISALFQTLHENIKIKFDKQKINSIKSTTEAYVRFLKNKKLTEKNANKENAKDFYIKLVIGIQKASIEENNVLMYKEINEKMEFINTQVYKLSKELEEKYQIDGLDKEFSFTKPTEMEGKEIEFEKGFLRIVLDVFLLGNANFVKYYAEQMCKKWEEETYGFLLKGIDNYNKSEIKLRQDEFDKQSDSIVRSIGEKLNAIEKSIIDKQKDREEYNKKIEKMKSTFIKINNFKETINKQVKELYG
jgi:hypothetical protein